MVAVTLFCKIVGDKGSAFEVEIDDGKSVSAFQKAIKDQSDGAITVPSTKLPLFLAKKEDGKWLDGAEAATVTLDGDGNPQGFEEMNPTLYIKNRKHFGADFQPGEGQVHVLVVIPERPTVSRDITRDEDLPPAKRVKLAQVEVAYQDPVPKDFFSVPMETIDTYQQLQAAFLSPSIARLCLLYGPRQFGKTTIAHRLRNFLAEDPSVLVIYFSLVPSIVQTEEAFWLAISKSIGEEMRSSKEFNDMFWCRKKRVWLAINEMDVMFENEKLTTDFMNCLRQWQTSPCFLGFLGIGSHDLLNMPMKFKGGTYVSPFNLGEPFRIKPFSTKQMSDFFKQINGRYPFRDSIPQAIIGYSSGAPGVFGSLIRYSIDFDKCNQERHQWEHWFKIQSFSNYLDTHNWAYKRLREDLQT